MAVKKARTRRIKRKKIRTRKIRIKTIKTRRIKRRTRTKPRKVWRHVVLIPPTAPVWLPPWSQCCLRWLRSPTTSSSPRRWSGTRPCPATRRARRTSSRKLRTTCCGPLGATSATPSVDQTTALELRLPSTTGGQSI